MQILLDANDIAGVADGLLNLPVARLKMKNKLLIGENHSKYTDICVPLDGGV